MKKYLIVICFSVCSLLLFSTEMIHNYFGDYKEVVRVVFVFKSPVHYSSLLDTDNKALFINVYDTRLNPALKKLNFDDSPLISHLDVAQTGRDIKISLYTNVVYYAETFFHREENFKVVVDIYRQREPATIEQAREYLNFFRTVGYTDRAVAMQRRINNNEFFVPIYFADITPPPPSPPPVLTPPVIEPPIPKFEINPLFSTQDPFLYENPLMVGLSETQKNWIHEAFRVYETFKEIRDVIRRAEETLVEYDSKRNIDVSFLETMSQSHNTLSDASIRINEIRLQYINLMGRKNFPNIEAIEYTEGMINHVISYLEIYRGRIMELQAEYNRRIHR